MPKISVVMPVYNGAKHIREAIESVLAQTFTDWDCWIINEYGSDDGSAKIVQDYASSDSRFHLVQNDKKLGLAESLNLGFRLSEGEYIARLDADDLAHPERFIKQVALMDNQPNVGICGAWQRHFGKDTDWVHKPQALADDCRARLLFNCDLCHSTLMLRRETIFKHNLFYDHSFAAEDYELWCRAMLVTDIVNIPEVLGEYRVGEDNITVAKKGILDEEHVRIVARTLQQTLGIILTGAEQKLFYAWRNPFDEYLGGERQSKLVALERILRQIYLENVSRSFFAESSLLNTLAAKWNWAKYHAPRDYNYDIQNIEQVFAGKKRPGLYLRYRDFCAKNKTFGAKCKKVAVALKRLIDKYFVSVL